MTHPKGFALIAVAAALLSGCVVTPIDRGPGQPGPQYQAPRPGPLKIAGAWGVYEGDQLVRNIRVQRTTGGIIVDTPRQRGQFAERIARGAFRDDRGRVYQFTSNIDGVFDNPNNGRRLRLVRQR